MDGLAVIAIIAILVLMLAIGSCDMARADHVPSTPREIQP
jgi:hypothetical protein